MANFLGGVHESLFPLLAQKLQITPYGQKDHNSVKCSMS